MAVIDGIEVGGSSYGFKAEALVSPLTINGVSFDGTDNITSYAVCSTAAGTAAKVATIGNKFVLGSGAMVTVKFTYANTASNPTLNVNGTGAAAIMINGSTAAGDEAWAGGETVAFVYDGTSWHLVGAQGPQGPVGPQGPQGEQAGSIITVETDSDGFGINVVDTVTNFWNGGDY